MAADARPSGRRPVREVLKRPSPTALLALAGTIVGLVSGIAGLVFLFQPDLKPTGEASTQAVTLSQLRVRPNSSFKSYLAVADLPETGLTKAQLARRGALLRFRAKITGFEDEPLTFKWELFDSKTGEQIDESTDQIFRPTTETNEATWPFWVPLPKRPGPFYVVVELRQQKEHHQLALDSIESDPFPGLASS